MAEMQLRDSVIQYPMKKTNVAYLKLEISTTIPPTMGPTNIPIELADIQSPIILHTGFHV